MGDSGRLPRPAHDDDPADLPDSTSGTSSRAHFGGLTRLWVADETSRLGAGRSAADETVVGGPAPALSRLTDAGHRRPARLTHGRPRPMTGPAVWRSRSVDRSGRASAGPALQLDLVAAGLGLHEPGATQAADAVEGGEVGTGAARRGKVRGPGWRGVFVGVMSVSTEPASVVPEELLRSAKPFARCRRTQPTGSAAEGGVDDLLGLGLHLGEVLGALERLGVDLVDVLGAGRAGGEPRALGGHLEAADRRAVAGRLGQLGRDRLSCKGVRGDVARGRAPRAWPSARGWPRRRSARMPGRRGRAVRSA